MSVDINLSQKTLFSGEDCVAPDLHDGSQLSLLAAGSKKLTPPSFFVFGLLSATQIKLQEHGICILICHSSLREAPSGLQDPWEVYSRSHLASL